MAIIFADGFESGDTTAWDAVYNSGDLEVVAEAAIVGSYGLKIKQGASTPQVESDFASVSRYRFAFYFDPNSIEIIEGTGEIDPPYIGPFYADLGTVNVKKISGSYYVFIEAYDDTYSVAQTSADYLITDGPHTIEVDWQKATNSSSNDGYMSLWIDAAFKETLSGVDNFITHEFSLIGHTTNYFGDFTGNFYLDGFCSNDDGSQIYGEESASLSPSASLSISPSASVSISPSVSRSISLSASESPSVSPSASISGSPSLSPSSSASRSASRSLSPSASFSISPSSSVSKSASASKSPSASFSISPSSSKSPSASRSSSFSLSQSPSLSRSISPSLSPSFSLSISGSASPSLEATSIYIRDWVDAYDWGVYFTNVSDGTFKVYRPTDTQNGDLLVVIVGKQGAADVTPPVGWTTGAEGTGTAGNDTFGGIYYKRITDIDSEPDPGNSEYYTFTSAGTYEPVGWYAASLVNVSLNNPEDVDFDAGSGNWTYLENDTSPAAPAVTTVTDDTLAFACWAVNNDPGFDGYPISPWIARAQIVGGNGVLTVYSKNIFIAGSTGSPEISGLLANQDTETGMFVFRRGITSVSASPSASGSVSLSVSPSGSLSISASRSLSASRSVSVSRSRSLSRSASVSPSVSPSLSSSFSQSISFSASISLSPSISLSLSPSESLSLSFSESPSLSASFSFSISPSASVSHSASPSAAPRYKVRVQMMQ